MPWRADEGTGGGRDRRDPGAVTCERVREWIDPLLDGDLERPREEALDAHLADCPDCRSELALVRRLREALREGLPMLSCPPEVSAEVLRIAREEAGARPRAGARRRAGRPARGGTAGRWAAWLAGGGVLRPALVAAALVLLLLAAPVLYRSVVPSDAVAPAGTAERAQGGGEPSFSDAEVAEAEEQARLVLAYVASVGRDAGRAVQGDVLDPGIVRPTRRVMEGLQAAGAGLDGGERNRP